MDLGRIIVEPDALVQTEESLFPASRHRSARIRKKLIKRFGGEYRMEPACFKTPHGLIMHPVLYNELQRQTRERP